MVDRLGRPYVFVEAGDPGWHEYRPCCGLFEGVGVAVRFDNKNKAKYYERFKAAIAGSGGFVSDRTTRGRSNFSPRCPSIMLYSGYFCSLHVTNDFGKKSLEYTLSYTQTARDRANTGERLNPLMG